LRPLCRECQRTIGRAVEADLCQRDGVSQDVDVELLPVVVTEGGHRKADDGHQKIKLK